MAIGRLPGGPLFGSFGNTVDADPAVRIEILLTVEFGGAAAGLRIETDEKF